MDEQLQANRDKWDELVAINTESAYYDLEGFRAGRSSLDRIAVDELGDVRGCSVLHLLCHIGLDTLSLARSGAAATGMDFSEPAIAFGRNLAEELDLDASFVCCDLYDLPDHLEGRFDIVLMSYGVVGWLHDLDRWAEIVAAFLAPGGRLHVIEFHPFAEMFDDESSTPTLRYPYFRSAEAVRTESQRAYADPNAELEHEVAYSWPAGISDVITSVLGAGLVVDGFSEYPWCNEQLRPIFVQCDDGMRRSPPGTPQVPIVYALRASEPG
jgi:SAM-dependent methyltransferase